MKEIIEYRMHKGLHSYWHLKVKGSSHFNHFELLTFLSMLFVMFVDIETNPGPVSNYLSPSPLDLIIMSLLLVRSGDSELNPGRTD